VLNGGRDPWRSAKELENGRRWAAQTLACSPGHTLAWNVQAYPDSPGYRHVRVIASRLSLLGAGCLSLAAVD